MFTLYLKRNRRSTQLFKLDRNFRLQICTKRNVYPHGVTDYLAELLLKNHWPVLLFFHRNHTCSSEQIPSVRKARFNLILSYVHVFTIVCLFTQLSA